MTTTKYRAERMTMRNEGLKKKTKTKYTVKRVKAKKRISQSKTTRKLTTTTKYRAEKMMRATMTSEELRKMRKIKYKGKQRMLKTGWRVTATREQQIAKNHLQTSYA